MACIQRTDSASPADEFDTHLSTDFQGLDGYAYQAAHIWSKLPPGTPISIATLRTRLNVGRHIASRVLRELTLVGFAAAQRVRDTTTGRLLGRFTVWRGTTREPTDDTSPDDHPVRALKLLGSLAAIDPRLAFKSRELRTLVPHVIARYAEGDTDDEIRTRLTKDLPANGRRIKTGLLHYRLTARPAATRESSRAPDPRPLVECPDCRRPSRDLAPGSLCVDCHENAGTSDPAGAVTPTPNRVPPPANWRLYTSNARRISTTLPKADHPDSSPEF